MGRSKSSAGAAAQQDTDNNDSDNKSTITVHTWDGTQLTKPRFYTSGRLKLLDDVRGARRFITHGTCLLYTSPSPRDS